MTSFLSEFFKKCGFAFIAFNFFSAISYADNFPQKPIHLVVPYSPGAGTDVIARIIGTRLSEDLKQQIVIDNHPGAGGSIGTEIVAHSTGDGYTLLFSPASFAINPSLYGRLNFDTKKELAPISIVASLPVILAVPTNSPFHTLKELMQYAKNNPDKLSMASSGNGSVFHLTGELFKEEAKINFIHIPFKGGSPAVTSLLGGQVSLIFETPVTLMPHIKSGKLMALSVASPKRLSILPNVPTFAEEGYPLVAAENWYGFFAPIGTPQNIIDFLYDKLQKTLNDPDTKSQLNEQGASIRKTTPNDTSIFINSELSKWAKIVKISGATVD